MERTEILFMMYNLIFLKSCFLSLIESITFSIIIINSIQFERQSEYNTITNKVVFHKNKKVYIYILMDNLMVSYYIVIQVFK